MKKTKDSQKKDTNLKNSTQNLTVLTNGVITYIVSERSSENKKLQVEK